MGTCHVSRVTTIRHHAECGGGAPGHALVTACHSLLRKEGDFIFIIIIHYMMLLVQQIIYLPSKLHDVPRSDVSSSSLCTLCCALYCGQSMSQLCPVIAAMALVLKGTSQAGVTVFEVDNKK